MNKGYQDAPAKTTAQRASNALHSLAAHPSWIAFAKFCQELEHGEMENLKIQDGLPVMAENRTQESEVHVIDHR